MVPRKFDPEAEKLIAESRRLREELIRTTSRLEVFSNQLTHQVAKLRDVANQGNTDDEVE